MLDEPSQGIMPKLVDEIFQAVKRIRDAGMTVLIVEQRMSECLEIADRAYILQTGRVLMQGSAAEIRVNPDVRKGVSGAVVAVSGDGSSLHVIASEAKQSMRAAWREMDCFVATLLAMTEGERPGFLRHAGLVPASHVLRFLSRQRRMADARRP